MTMRPGMSVSLSLSFENDLVNVTEIYTITLRDGSVYRYTTHPESLTWDADGNTYSPRAISRDAIRFGLNLEPDATKVYLAAAETDGLIEQGERNNLDFCNIVIKRIFYNVTYSPDDEVTIFEGYADIEFNRNLLILELKPWIDSLNIMVPRHIYQEPCNHHIFDVNCGLIQESFSYHGTANAGNRTTLIDPDRGLLYKVNFDGGDLTDTIKKGEIITGSIGAGTAQVVNIMYESDATGRLWFCQLSGTLFVDDETLLGSGGASVTADGVPAEENLLFRRGELEIRSGQLDGQRRPILQDESWTTTVMWPFSEDISWGNSYTLYPGCTNKAKRCHSWYDNAENFRGFLFVPKVEETIY